MDLQSLFVFFAFALSIISIAGLVGCIVQVANVQSDWARESAQLDALYNELSDKQDLLKDTLEKVHKLHLERNEDLNPILDRLAVLEVRTTAISANQMQKRHP